MGKTYLKPHEDGRRSVFASFTSYLGPMLGRIDAARKAFIVGLKP
jgi:hypothetical protein